MVNQQLKDYISEQVRVGVSKDAIKGALIEAGWAEAEVNEAMGMGGMSVAASPRMDAIASGNAAKPMQTMPAQAAAKPAMAMNKPMAQAQIQKPQVQNFPANGRMIGAATGGAPAMAAKPATMKTEPMRPAKPMNDMISAKRDFVPATAVVAGSGHSGPGRHRLVDIVMGILILVLGATGVALFAKNSSLAKELGLAANDNGAVSSQVAALTAEKSTLQSENESLHSDSKVLQNELGIVASPRASGEETVEVQGVLTSTGDKSPYVLRTPHDLVLTIKNSRTPAADAALTPFLGKSLVLTATHVVTSKDLNATAINGTPITLAIPASSTASSSAH